MWWWCRAAVRPSLAVVWHLETTRCTAAAAVLVTDGSASCGLRGSRSDVMVVHE